MLLGSSQSVNANYFPLFWEIRGSGSQAVGSNAVCCLPLLCDTTPQRPFGCIRAYVNSMNVNFLFALFAVFLRLWVLQSTSLLNSTKHTFKCDYTFLCILVWIPCMQSYLLSAIFNSLQWLASLKRQHYIWSNLSSFFYWIFLLKPDIFTAYYFTKLSYLVACPWNICVLYLKHQSCRRASSFISALVSLQLLNYEKLYSGGLFIDNTYFSVVGDAILWNLLAAILSYTYGYVLRSIYSIYFQPGGLYTHWELNFESTFIDKRE